MGIVFLRACTSPILKSLLVLSSRKREVSVHIRPSGGSDDLPSGKDTAFLDQYLVMVMILTFLDRFPIVFY